MWKMVFAATAMLFLAACGSTNVAEGLTLVNNTIESTARVTETALHQGHVDVATACKIEIYGRLARAAVDAGFDSYVTQDLDGAEQHLAAARNILNGVSAEANAQIAKEC